MYQIKIEPLAQRTLKKLPETVREKIAEFIAKLAEDPRPEGCKKLKGHYVYRVRSGDYRIIYEIRDEVLLVIVIKLGHRKDIQEIIVFLFDKYADRKWFAFFIPRLFTTPIAQQTI